MDDTADGLNATTPGCSLTCRGARMFQFLDPDGFKLGVSTPLAG